MYALASHSSALKAILIGFIVSLATLMVGTAVAPAQSASSPASVDMEVTELISQSEEEFYELMGAFEAAGNGEVAAFWRGSHVAHIEVVPAGTCPRDEPRAEFDAKDGVVSVTLGRLLSCTPLDTDEVLLYTIAMPAGVTFTTEPVLNVYL